MNDRPMHPRIHALLDAERARPDAPAHAKDAARARLAALLGPGAGLDGDGGGGAPGGDGATAPPTAPAAPPNGAAVASASSGLAIKLAGALLVGGLAGGGVVASIVKPAERIVYVSAPEASASSVPPAAVAANASGTALPVGALPDVPPAAPAARTAALGSSPAPSTSVTSSPEPRGRDTDLSAERALIERARSALARGDGAGALAAVGRHEDEFAKGQLAEEREVVAVQALVAVGRVQEAAERGARFRKAYPSSLLLPIVDAALR